MVEPGQTIANGTFGHSQSLSQPGFIELRILREGDEKYELIVSAPELLPQESIRLSVHLLNHDVQEKTYSLRRMLDLVQSV